MQCLVFYTKIILSEIDNNSKAFLMSFLETKLIFYNSHCLYVDFFVLRYLWMLSYLSLSSYSPTLLITTFTKKKYKNDENNFRYFLKTPILFIFDLA